MREFRHRLGLSQEEFGRQCGLDRTYVGGVERGERNPSYTSILRLAQALRARPSEIVARAEEIG